MASGQLKLFATSDGDDVEQRVDEEAGRGSLFAISHSGGKDSQAMTLEIAARVPQDQIAIFHAHLERVEWDRTIEHIEGTKPAGAPLIIAKVASGKTLLDRVRERRMWPDPGRRWCTSDFKRGPINREIRRYVAANPQYSGRVVSCIGLRAEESPRRRKRTPWRRDETNSRNGREWFEWLAIKEWTEDEVWSRIREGGQRPHWVYAEGMKRLSCSFCIFSPPDQICVAARLRPELAHEYMDIEDETGHTLSPSRRTIRSILESAKAPIER